MHDNTCITYSLAMHTQMALNCYIKSMGSISSILDVYINFVGVPQQPVINNAVSISPGVALLDVSTREAGIEDGGTFQFVVKAEVISSDTSRLFIQEITNYVDSTVTTLTINDLAPGVDYRLSIQIQNEFGSSEFSEASDLQIQKPISKSPTPIGINYTCIRLCTYNCII